MVFTRMSLPVAKHARSVLSLESTRVNLRAHYYFSLAHAESLAQDITIAADKV